MMGRFVDVIASCQQACRDTGTFTNYPARTHIKDLLLLDQPQYLMDEEVSILSFNLPAYQCMLTFVVFRYSVATYENVVTRP